MLRLRCYKTWRVQKMLLIKYERTDTAKYIPHVDMLRQIARVLRRAQISVEYSQGFNPHELIFFAPPIPLGLSSKADYCAIATKESVEGFIEKFNAKSIKGLKAVACCEVEKNPNIAGKAVSAKYSFSADDETLERIKEAFSRDAFEITYTQKGESVTKDVRSLMVSYDFSGEQKTVTLSHGNTNLRADRFFSSFGVKLTSVEKIAEYVEENGKVKNADEYFR